MHRLFVCLTRTQGSSRLVTGHRLIEPGAEREAKRPRNILFADPQQSLPVQVFDLVLAQLDIRLGESFSLPATVISHPLSQRGRRGGGGDCAAPPSWTNGSSVIRCLPEEVSVPSQPAPPSPHHASAHQTLLNNRARRNEPRCCRLGAVPYLCHGVDRNQRKGPVWSARRAANAICIGTSPQAIARPLR